MKIYTRFISLAVIAAFLGIFTAFATTSTKTVTASNKIIDKDMSVGDFHDITLSCQGKVVYSQGAKTSIRVNGADNIVPLVELKNDGGKLKIKFRDNVKIDLGDNNNLVFHITTPNVSGLNVVGSGDIDVNGAINAHSSLNLSVTGSGDIETKDIRSSGALKVSVTGSGDINMDISNTASNISMTVVGSGDIECENPAAHNMTCTLNGSGDIEIKGGRTTKAIFDLSGSGDIAAKRMKAGNVDATVRGSGNVICNAIESLKTSITGSGNVKYIGNPKVIVTGTKKPDQLTF